MTNQKRKIFRITTVPISLGRLLKGQLRFMNNHYDVIGISTGGDGLEEVRKEEGIRVIPIKLTRAITPLNDLKALWAMYRLIRKEKPFIVHTHTPKAGTIGMLASKLAGTKHRLHTVAGLPLMEAVGPKRILLNFVEKLTYACATKVYPNSKGLKAFILESKFTKADKIQVLGQGSSNGIDTVHFDPELYSVSQQRKLKAALGISESDVVFIFVGRLVTDKGINELINAFKRINVENPGTKLLLVGTPEKELDPLAPETDQEIEKNPNIISVGWQEDVRPFFSISDALTFPSYREGFPNVVMQAGAMGIFSIVTDINGCNEIIIEGENGTIIPKKDSQSLYNAMKNYMENQYDHINLTSIRKLITSRYDQNFIWNQILIEYRGLEKG